MSSSPATSTDNRDDIRIIDALRQNGETNAATVRSVTELTAGRLDAAIERLTAAGSIETRVFDNALGRRVALRLTGQPLKEGIEKGLQSSRLSDFGRRNRARREEAEKLAADGGATFSDRVLAAFGATGERGLTMTQAVAAFADEDQEAVREKVRALWRAGKLARRRDGTFVLGDHVEAVA